MHDTLSFESTSSAAIDSILEETLRELVSTLGSRTGTAAGREDRHRAMSYHGAVVRWAAVPPTQAQRDMMVVLVTALSAKVARSAPTAPMWVDARNRPTVRVPCAA